MQYFWLLNRLESAIPLLQQKIASLPDTSDVSIAFPDDGAYKRFHLHFDKDYPIIVCNKVRDGDKRIVKVKEGRFLFSVLSDYIVWIVTEHFVLK